MGYVPKNKNACFDWISLFNTYKENVKNKHIVIETGASYFDRTVDLSKYCKKLIGIEKYKNRIPELGNLSNINYLVGKWEQLSNFFQEESIDIIISSHVIEHIENDLLCINESYKILKKGGILLFNTPNRKRLTRVIIEIFTGKRSFPFWEHQREYIKSDLQKLIDKSHFNTNNVEIKGIAFGLHGGNFYFYLKKFPLLFEKYSSFWQVKMIK